MIQSKAPEQFLDLKERVYVLEKPGSYVCRLMFDTEHRFDTLKTWSTFFWRGGGVIWVSKHVY